VEQTFRDSLDCGDLLTPIVQAFIEAVFACAAQAKGRARRRRRMARLPLQRRACDGKRGGGVPA